jgi:hypothetical protein
MQCARCDGTLQSATGNALDNQEPASSKQHNNIFIGLFDDFAIDQRLYLREVCCLNGARWCKFFNSSIAGVLPAYRVKSSQISYNFIEIFSLNAAVVRL